MNLQGKVYSYLRFSDSKQADGDSAKRQTEYASKWAAERGLLLDHTLSMRDEGLSAYHQHHVKSGALGLFLRAIEDRKVPAGSVLVVESLDRLSRAEPLLAQAQLTQIINAGVTVVTASDNREYNRERLRAQPMDLVYSLLVMIRAHEESETKSRRVKAAVRRRCMEWASGAFRGVIRSGSDPSWVELVDGRFQLVPDRAKAIKIAAGMYRKGDGAIAIIRHLAALGISPTVKNLSASHFYDLIRNRALVGEKTLTLDGEVFRLTDYYPAVLTEPAFQELQQEFGARGRRKGKGTIPGVLTGVGVCFCGYCGMAMAGNNRDERKRKTGDPRKDVKRRLVCNSTTTVDGCEVPGSIGAPPVERAVLEFCSDAFNLASLMKPSGLSEELGGRLALARQALADTERRLAKVAAALADSDDDAPMVFIRKARELEAKQVDQTREVEELEYRLRSATRELEPSGATEWARISRAAMMLDYDARMTARNLVRESFSTIQIFHRGLSPPAVDQRKRGKEMMGGEAAIVIVSRTGNSRTLLIDRETGDWKAADVFTSLPMPDGVEEIAPRPAASGGRRR